jgi:asparagine synthase (glutamine-hydrolysing)
VANFVLVVDPDVERRSRFIRVIEPQLAPVGGLVTSTCAAGNFCAVWACQEEAPVSYAAGNQDAAIIWGDAITGTKPTRMTPAQLKRLWGNLTHDMPDACDGFHAAVVYQADNKMIVGADLLGIYPVYYYAAEEVVLVGSSPELFRHHPAFRMEFNPTGLVGMLLTMHIFDGQTLLRGVRRLAAGHLLIWSHGAAPKEVQQYKPPVSTRYFDLPFTVHVNLLDQVLDEAITCYVPADKQYSLLLSGGLDSRMLGGFLKQNRIDTVALTLGLPSDNEVRCAIPVARTLGLEHHVANIPLDQYPLYANLQARWEHVANGFNFIMNWGVHPYLSKLAARVVAGYLTDSVIGGSHIVWAYSPSDNNLSFETFFARINGWGIQPEVLKKLLRYEVFGDLVQETVVRIRQVYESYSDIESQRAWCFDLYHRQRFHVGSSAWALCFGAWPVLPVISRRVLETAGAMPAATLADRHAQVELLYRRFSELAALPLDRNTYNIEPLRPRMRHVLARRLYRRLRPLRRLGQVIENRRGERRYYYRIYDLNGPGWLAVRQQAEPLRERVVHLVNKDVLDELLPAPGVPLRLKDGIIDASGLKVLLGFTLWSKNHL